MFTVLFWLCSENEEKAVTKELDICGFIDIKDIANPPHISRHLVLPLPTASSAVKSDGIGHSFRQILRCVMSIVIAEIVTFFKF